MKVTIKDVARRAGVSIATVSRVVNGQLQGASEETRNRILQAMHDLGYEPNYIARSMVTKRTGTIGLLIPDIANPFFPDVARGVEDAANNAGVSVFLCNTDGDLVKEKRVITSLSQRSVDGFIATTQNRDEDNTVFDTLHRKGVPVVFIERYALGDSGIPGVYFENEAGAVLATKHLISEGHRNIACLAGPLGSTNARQRLLGFKKACTEAGIDTPDNMVIEGDYKIDGGYKATRSLLENPENKVTAIFACNDLMAIGAIQAAKELGVKVPEELAVIGFDNIFLGGMMEPSISTVEIPGYELGKKAAEMMLDLLEGKELSQKQHMFTPELIIRQSSKRNR